MLTNTPELTALATAVSESHGQLLAHVLSHLPAEHVAALDRVLATGGDVGLQVTTNRDGRRRMVLIAIEHEGARHELAEFSTLLTSGDVH